MSNSFVSPWTVTHQALLSMEFSRQEYWGEKKKEYWSGLSCPPEGKGKREEGSFFPGDVRNQLASLVLAGGFFTTKPHGKLY